MAFFFVVLILSKLLFSRLEDWPKTRYAISREVILFCIICVIYYIWAFINMHYFPQAPVTDVAYQLNHPNFNIREIIQRLAILGNVFGPIWALSPLSNGILQGWIMIALFSLAIVFAWLFFIKSEFYLRNKSRAWQWGWQVVAAVCV
ncbi:MAG: hypothetical protein ACD_45C00525G0001, partial [uncultured bacterium]